MKTKRKKKTVEPVTGQLYAPNGRQIIASKDLVPGNAMISSVTLDENGDFYIDWDGETEMCWDGQYTERDKKGQPLYIDEDGCEWPENKLTVKPEAGA